jgi:hypothetical protein
MLCWFCDRTGWVCENHVGRPWRALSRRSDACACGAGAACACTREADLRSTAEMIHDTFRLGTTPQFGSAD